MWTVVAIMLAPLAWTILTSLKPDSETMQYPPTLLPAHPTLFNYGEVFRVMPFGDFFSNSLVAATVSSFLTIVIAAPAAYAMVRLRFFGSDAVGFVGLVAYMIPTIVIIVPVFRVAYSLHALDSIPPLIVLYTVTFLPFAVWQLRAYFAGIPRDLEAAALVDGATRLESFFLVILPLAVPGLIATAVFAFSVCWSEYLFASLLLFTPSNQTLSPGMATALIGGIHLYSWGVLMAGSTLMTVPIVALFTVVQRRLVTGITAGAVQQ